MKAFLLLAALLHASALADDAQDYPDYSQLLQDVAWKAERASSQGEAWKSTVSLHFERPGGSKKFRCSGSWIAPDLILTAGHCNINDQAPLQVQFRLHNGQGDQIMLPYQGKEYVFRRPPGYVSRENDLDVEDLGLVYLRRNPRLPEGFATATLAPASLPGARLDSTAYVVGAGLNEKEEFTDGLFYLTGKLKAFVEGGNLEIAFPEDQGICAGDSGGPVFSKNGNHLELMAVTISVAPDLSDKCGRTHYSILLTKSRRTWIDGEATLLRRGR
jgi:V8-like Glu-specific endopeptidase